MFKPKKQWLDPVDLQQQENGEVQIMVWTTNPPTNVTDKFLAEFGDLAELRPREGKEALAYFLERLVRHDHDPGNPDIGKPSELRYLTVANVERILMAFRGYGPARTLRIGAALVQALNKVVSEVTNPPAPSTRQRLWYD